MKVDISHKEITYFINMHTSTRCTIFIACMALKSLPFLLEI